MLADKGIDTLSNLEKYSAKEILDVLEFYQIQAAMQQVISERD